MESPRVASPVLSTLGTSSRTRSNTKLADDVTCLTSFNPFSEEDENDQSSFTLVTSIFSRMKSTLTAPLSSAVSAASSNTNFNANGIANELRRPPFTMQHSHSSLPTRAAVAERPNSLSAVPSSPAPPLVSVIPALPEAPSYDLGADRFSPRGGMSYSPEGGLFATAIPGFPIPDDARSIRTATSFQRPGSVSKVIRRVRGEGLSRDYWMDDENCKECFDCGSIFTTWRRKHHCRICGQIFCSRCASNLIKGSRFGHDGTIRVCNLCLEKLTKDDDDDDDDRRSIISFPSHQLGMDSLSLSLGHHSQSSFGPSQLVGRMDEPYNLYSIAEAKRPKTGSDENGVSRPVTPSDILEGERRHWHLFPDNPAPFRRGLSEQEKDAVAVSDSFINNDSVMSPGSKTPLNLPIVNTGGPISSIQFPVGSPDQGMDSPRPRSRARSRFNSYGDFDVATPFIRSRVQSRLDGVLGDPGWRTRRESTAYAQELNIASMNHLKIMLRQMLTLEKIPDVREWEKTLLRLSLRIARDLTFTSLPHRQGEDMDVRRYVKIKKIPGGAPQDSEYVDGAVITKNVAHKQMSRLHGNPRVMFVTFPLEFHRVEGQYMHFRQIVRQEKEYLGNLASRIAALRPHVVLVEKSVSRLALEALARHNIAVARTVKPSAIQFVARMTQGDVFSSIDKLALEPRLGHCARFRIQTYDNPHIPGQRKTYMRFEGCNRDMGCTIILRGGDIDTLKRIKKVTRFLTFIVRNLKLETHLWKDLVITLPPLNADAIPSSLVLSPPFSHLSVPSSPAGLKTPTTNVPPSASRDIYSEQVPGDDLDLPDEDQEQLNLSRRIRESLEPYTRTFISVSATLRFPPPQPILRMKELDDELLAAKRAWEDEVIRREEKELTGHLQDVTVTQFVSVTESHDAQMGLFSDIPIATTPSLEPPSPIPAGSPDLSLSITTTPLLAPPGPVLLTISPTSITQPEVPVVRKTNPDITLESRLSDTKWRHKEQRRIWEWYLRKNHDDFVMEKYQCISLLQSTIPIAELGHRRACFPPSLMYITFYGENDCTLGQYIEKVVNDTLVNSLDAKAICSGKGCNQPLARHCQIYVHNETQLFAAVEPWDGQIVGRSSWPPTPDLITTWSICKVCGSATPFIPISDEMQRYSFAKFLELHFYPADVKLVQGAGCPHNIYQHHIRYFALKGLTVRFQSDPVVLHEIVYPAVHIRVRPETQLEMKNVDYDWLLYRNDTWYNALVDDLKLISIDAATGDEYADARLLADINALIQRAEAERQEINNLLHRVYGETPPIDTLAFNHVRAFRRDRLVAWQQDFDRLPKPRPPQSIGKSGRKGSAFGSVREMWPRRYGVNSAFENPHLPSSSMSEIEEGHLSMRRVTGDSFASSASETSEPETIPEQAEKEQDAAIPTAGVPVEPPVSNADASQSSDLDSDSTIGAARDEPSTSGEQHKPVPDEPSEAGAPPRVSRLPRRTSQYPSVAELVKKYQDFLPPDGVQELAITAFPPQNPVSESEQEYVPLPRPTARNKSRHLPAKKPSVSDFEQGYAANVAPRYLTHPRRQVVRGCRIPGPVGESSLESSRRPSPDKRSSEINVKAGKKTVRLPPTPGNKPAATASAPQPPKAKSGTRARLPANVGTKPPLRRTTSGHGNKVSNIAKHFERINRDHERANRRYAVIRGKRARPVAIASAKVEILDSIKDVIMDESESSDSSEADDEGEGDDHGQKPIERPIEPSQETQSPVPEIAVDVIPPRPGPVPENEIPPQEKLDALTEPPPAAVSPRQSPTLLPIKPSEQPSQHPDDLDIGPGGTELPSIFKAISGLWLQQYRRSEFETEDPISDPEHIFRDSSMVVRTDEPTSIIALALNSPQYREMLAKSRAEKRTAREPKLTDGGEAFMPDDRSVAESTSTWGVVNVESVDLPDPTEELKVPSSKLPWAISFESGGLTISCTLLYPEQFDALRRTYDCEKSMVESLAYCVKWNASGGKSGSAFLKTRDGRFIAKELSKAELQTMETFAPAYFDYMSSAISGNRPTLLAKVFGCYKLTFKRDKGTSKSKSTQMNLLVMENLFHDRHFSKIYDLKGSTRNRRVQSTGRENEVLLDENLVETAHLAPFYLREHTKRIFRGSLYNDTKFLADINVMDYSLVVGIDSNKNELVVGIVDYIRTYTWDKRVESWVKESAFLGGTAGGGPTVVTPKQYRQRFISAMERYFPLVPDRWMKQRDTPEEESNLLELWPDW